jgi:hypothetical protein
MLVIEGIYLVTGAGSFGVEELFDSVFFIAFVT